MSTLLHRAAHQPSGVTAATPPRNLRSRPRPSRSAATALTTALLALGMTPGLAAGETQSPPTSPNSPATTPSTPAEAPSPVPIAFDARGFADVRTGIRGRVNIAGTFAGTYDPQAGTYEGTLTLTPTVAHIVVLGILPVAAETDWIFTERVTGRWQDGVLSLHTAARIHHAHLSAFGVVIAGGGKCATRLPSILDLQTDPAQPTSDLLAGGTLTTRGRGFTISALAGCGLLDGLLSAVAAGDGNQATLTLTPRPAN